jgi:hypothetical protein
MYLADTSPFSISEFTQQYKARNATPETGNDQFLLNSEASNDPD